MFPGIESAAQASQAIRHLHYPPDGDRGVATYDRAYGFGLHPERLKTANQRVLGIVQIESKHAVERVEEITKVPGVHVLFIGPRDLVRRAEDEGVGGRGRADGPSGRRAGGAGDPSAARTRRDGRGVPGSAARVRR